MKTLFTALAIFAMGYATYAQCTPNGTLTLDNCLTAQGMPQSMNGFVSGCNGGSHPYATFQFVAPATCVDFDIASISGNGTGKKWQYRFLDASCSQVYEKCVEMVDDGLAFTISADNTTGIYQLVAGNTYYLQIMGDVNTTTFSICMSNTVQLSDACSGAYGLGTSPTSYYNGGAGCKFTGTYTGGSGDPSASSICAGTLENTQWIHFVPTAGTTNFQVQGSNIDCTGGNCAYQFGIFSSPSACGTLTPEGCVSNGNSCGSGPDPSQTVTSPTGTTAAYLMAWSGVSQTGFLGTVSIASGTFTGSEHFYLVMDGNAGASCSYTLQGINVAPLPVELVSFFVKKMNNGNLVKFEVAAQLDNNYYELERSEDTQYWSSFAHINGAGTTSQQSQYSFLDTEFRNTINYYRLKQVDFNGNVHYSEMVAVNNTDTEKAITACYDIQGKLVDVTTSGLVIIHYVDGTTQKVFNN